MPNVLKKDKQIAIISGLAESPAFIKTQFVAQVCGLARLAPV